MVERELTDKQNAFCREYLKDLNATQAAIRAGYSVDTAKQIACENLAKPYLHDRIQALMEERSKRTEISADYVLTKIRDTVERCSQAIPVEEFDHVDKCMKPTGEWKFEHMGVLKGCELLGKHLKLFTEKHEHTGAEGGPIELKAIASLPDEAVKAEIEALLAKHKVEGAMPKGEK